MTKPKDNDTIQDGERVRVPLMLMDSVQRSVAAHSMTMDAATASHHRPRYRLSVKMMRDHEARETLADAYGEYEDTLTNSWRNASPEPSPLLDEEFDDEEADCLPPTISKSRIRGGHNEY